MLLSLALGFLQQLPDGKHSILADDPRVLKIGRFVEYPMAFEEAAWSASAVEVKVRGQFLKVRFGDKGDNYLQVELNGEPKDVWHLKDGNNAFQLDLPAGTNDVKLVKRTEAFVGPVDFVGFETDPHGMFMKALPKERRIEFVGDSITCGYGNEGKSETEHFSPATENAYMSYASIAARSLDAEATLIAWSGRKMWPDNTMPSIFDFSIPTDPSSRFTFNKHPAPDAVVIHLATNDFGKDNPDKAKWCGAYEAFLKRLRSLYPKAYFFCAMGSMMSDDWPKDHKALSTLRDYLQTIVAETKAFGDDRVDMVEFAVQDRADGLGADWHPSIKTDQKMAAKLVEVMKKDLGW